MLKKVFGGNTEQKVIDSIKKHMQILYAASECFKKGLQELNKDQMYCVADLEREGDSVRREIPLAAVDERHHRHPRLKTAQSQR